MFEIIRGNRQIRRLEIENELAAQEYASKALAEASNVVVDDEVGWIPLTLDTSKGVDEDQLETMWAQARRMREQNATAQALVGNLINFVIGRGVIVDPEGEDKKRDKVWEAFKRRNKWKRFIKEMCNRTWRDGECFIRKFKVDLEGGDASIRFIDPERIKDSNGKVSFGIKTDPADVETPIAYMLVSADGKTQLDEIPAEEIIHLKIGVDANVKRGVSYLYGIMPMLTKYEQWLNDRILLNKVRTAVALVKTIKGGAADVNRIRAQQAATSNTERGDNRQKMLKGGTVFTVNEGVTLEFLSPNLQASDVKHDGRNILLSIAAAKQLPEYMVTGDASNSNFASTMVSESPGVRTFESWQDFFEEPVLEIYDWVVSDSQDPDSIDLGKEIEAKAVYPPLIARNLKEETDANSVMNAAGILSKATWAAQNGLNYDKEREQIEKEDIGTAEPG